MKILHTLHWIQFAGTEKVCVDLCNEMVKEHQVYLLSHDKIKPYIDDSIELIEFDFQKNRHNPLFLYQTAKLLEKIAPDTGAAMAWLKNRQPRQWRDKQDIEHSGNIDLNVKSKLIDKYLSDEDES